MRVNKNWKDKSGIYRIICRNRCYIGSAIDLYNRLAVHISHLRKNKHHSKFMQRCFNKYKEESFSIEILEFCSNNIEDLRTLELNYINLYKPDFNSTTPITYEHSKEMCEQISHTLKTKYKSGEIKKPKLSKGRKFNIYDYIGKIIKENLSAQEATDYLKLSNDSVINNLIRKGGYQICQDFVIIPTDKEYFNYIYSSVHNQKKLTTPIYQVFNNKIIKSTSASKQKVRKKILDSNNLIYYSKKNKSFYTFLGLIKYLPNQN